jgi:hypothetical protein
MISQVSIDDIRQKWNDAYKQNAIKAPFLTWLWHRDWINIFGKTYTSSYFCINNDIIAPFIRSGNTLHWSGGEEIADYLDLIGSDSKKEHAWVDIIEFCKQNGIESLYLRNVPKNSPTVTLFQRQSGTVIQKEDTTPILLLPKTWEAYVKSIPSKKNRHELERKIRKFEREHPDASVIESTNPVNDISHVLLLMEKHEDKKNFLTVDIKSFFRSIAKTFRTDISMLLLTINGVVIAATFSFITDSVYYLYNSGFDNTLYPNAGFYLKAMSIKRAIEKGYTVYNFLQGDERYKYELGAKDFYVYSITYQP